MARKGNRIIIKLVNKKTGSFYVTTKNRINTTDKLKIKKFDRKTKKHELFEEGKMK
ncbi:MAG TPA: 50S ribosomal protein L33 [Candidatus Dojkabacteria bacterium]|nr:50S ribosomal protein L33 [Candidatus Dojkabacteria bacterium]